LHYEILEMVVANKKATLYVKSVKTVTGTESFERRAFLNKIGDYPDRIEIEGKRMNGTFVMKAYQTETEPRYEFILPEDQQRVVEMVKEIASKHGLEVEVIDVSRENVLHRAMQREFENIKTFPTLIADSGEKLKGNFSQEQIESFLSES
jgi:hypothetical protein